MKKSFTSILNSLKKVSGVFDETGNIQKRIFLTELSRLELPANKTLILYSEIILFLLAHPSEAKTLQLAEKENSRIAGFLKKLKQDANGLFANSALPFTFTVTRFSHDCLRWLLSYPNIKIELDGFENPTLSLNEVLKLTLPSLEVSETSAGLENDDLLEIYQVKKQNRLPFLVNELSRFDDQPFLKDHLFDGLDIYIHLIPRDKIFSKAYNRLQDPTVFFHSEILKSFDYKTLLNTPLQPAVSLTSDAKIQAISTVKNAMVLTGRETDTSTYMDEFSFRLFELERGISVAIYGMTPQRQLPMESYVGYTLFKNGFPAAYGGAWVFGERSLFGINVFEQFRGGESGFILCQLLRVYRQTFRINYFEVEPYQYGLDNPEGIQSGAFWFYYRYGFRPLDKKLFSIAEKENEKRKSKKGYRTNEKVLVQFTDSNIAMNLGKEIPAKVLEITRKVTSMIGSKYDGNRLLAEKDCMRLFVNKTELPETIDKNEIRVLKEVALWAEAFKITNPEKLDKMKNMIRTKPVDLYEYQKLVLDFFAKK